VDDPDDKFFPVQGLPRPPWGIVFAAPGQNEAKSEEKNIRYAFARPIVDFPVEGVRKKRTCLLVLI
jgi:hypothetical protein